ncbi:MAG: hypothetical protein OXB89_01970, partial [Anaerolineaceae bacterium]|nr:hypothetical protein [Anaerolineaceae bacterium]
MVAGVTQVDVKLPADRGRRRRQGLLVQAGLIVLAALWLIPVVWTLSISFRPENSIQANLSFMLPLPFTLENYEFVFSSSRLLRWFVNSLFVAVVRTLLQIALCSLAAYAFARIHFPGRRILFPFVLIGLMVPGQATFIPVYLLFSNLRLLNTFSA